MQQNSEPRFGQQYNNVLYFKCISKYYLFTEGDGSQQSEKLPS